MAATAYQAGPARITLRATILASDEQLASRALLRQIRQR